MKKGLNKDISALIAQIILVFIFMIGSYFIFTGGRLSSYASVAAASSNTNYDLQVLYGKDYTTIAAEENILDKGTLLVRNPNNHVVTANVRLKISNSVDLDTVDIIINDKLLDTNNYEEKDGYYLIDVEQYEISAYESKNYETTIEGNPFYTNYFEYNYDITESFYY